MENLPEEASERMARVTKLLRTQRSLPAKLETVVDIAKRTVPNCDSAGVMLMIEGRPTTAAVTDRLAVEIDLVQYETGQGPCLAAIEDSHVVRIDVLESDSRFTRFAPGALDRDIESVLSMPLAVGDRVVGALNMYSHLSEAFDGTSERVAQPLAQHAAEAIATSPLYAYSLEMVDGLVESMENLAVVTRAAGIIRAEHGGSDEEALDRLRELALSQGTSLLTTAQSIVADHPAVPPVR